MTGRITTNASEYAVMVHPAQSIDVCNSRRNECSAVAIMVASIDIISNASATTVKINPR